MSVLGVSGTEGPVSVTHGADISGMQLLVAQNLA